MGDEGRPATFGTARYFDTWLFEFELDSLEDLEGRTESFLKQERVSFSGGIDRLAENLTDDQKADLYERYSDDYRRIEEDFPNILRSSLLLHLYSRFEHHLDELCNRMASDMKLAMSVKDLAGKGIVRSQTYMKKVVGLRFPDTSPEWGKTPFRGKRKEQVCSCRRDMRRRGKTARKEGALDRDQQA